MSISTFGRLPDWGSVLVVVAHPDDESFGLGAVISTFVDQGAHVGVLCLTHGEASTLHGVEGDLAVVRERELTEAADALGITEVHLLSYADGALAEVPLDEIAAHVTDLAERTGADGLLVFDVEGVTGHPDHAHATAATVRAAHDADLDVLAWTVTASVASALVEEHGAGFHGHDDVDLVIEVDRSRQLDAVHCHPSQAVPGSVLWRRLELTGDHEHLRWVHRSGSATRSPAGTTSGTTAGSSS
jgi:LmbE family N-acetylglucosaminyl deacetylase